MPHFGRVTLRLPVAGGVAQLVERLGRIEEARGSIPLTSTLSCFAFAGRGRSRGAERVACTGASLVLPDV